MLGCDLGRYVLGLGVTKSPALIDLNPLGIEIPHYAVLIIRTRCASVDCQLHNRVDRHPRHAASRAERIPLDQRRDDPGTTSHIQSAAVLQEITPADYSGKHPPEKSYEARVQGDDLFAFAWDSAYFRRRIYFKFCVHKEHDKSFTLCIASLHREKPRERT
jgi:hypothetical protein